MQHPSKSKFINYTLWGKETGLVYLHLLQVMEDVRIFCCLLSDPFLALPCIVGSCVSKVPLPTGFQVGSPNGTHQEKIEIQKVRGEPGDFFMAYHASNNVSGSHS